MTKDTSVPWVQPSHPDLIAVEAGKVPFSTRAVALQTFEPNAVVSKLTSATNASQRAYTTVQASKSTDIELNSDLVYCNHSCDPNLLFDMQRMEVRVVPHKPLNKGDELSFFYPSTEWDMSQPFMCTCGAKGKCIGEVRGAKHLDIATLKKYWLNDHIVELLAEREVSTSRP